MPVESTYEHDFCRSGGSAAGYRYLLLQGAPRLAPRDSGGAAGAGAIWQEAADRLCTQAGGAAANYH